jgi:hypothetical protein
MAGGRLATSSVRRQSGKCFRKRGVFVLARSLLAATLCVSAASPSLASPITLNGSTVGFFWELGSATTPTQRTVEEIAFAIVGPGIEVPNYLDLFSVDFDDMSATVTVLNSFAIPMSVVGHMSFIFPTYFAGLSSYSGPGISTIGCCGFMHFGGVNPQWLPWTGVTIQSGMYQAGNVYHFTFNLSTNIPPPPPIVAAVPEPPIYVLSMIGLAFAFRRCRPRIH